MNNSSKYFGLGQLVLGLCLFVCLLLKPSYLLGLDQGGVSNYGTDDQTVVLFTIGFSAVVIGSIAAGLTLPHTTKRKRQLSFSLYLLGLLYLLVLVSTFPYKLNSEYEFWHLAAGFCLSLVMLVGVLWLRFVATNDTIIKRLFVVYMIGFGIALATLSGLVDLLLTVQIICGISFGLMVMQGIKLATKNTHLI